MASSFHNDLNEKVLLVRYGSRRQDSDVKIFAFSDMLSPTLVVKKLIQSDLVLDKTLPLVQPLI